jgi:hypothetical protein
MISSTDFSPDFSVPTAKDTVDKNAKSVIKIKGVVEPMNLLFIA